MTDIAWTAAMRTIAERLFLLEGIEEEARRELWKGTPSPVGFEKGESIYTCRTFRRALGLVLQGEAQAYRAGEDGRRVVMNRLRPGQAFGAAALFGDCDTYVTEIAAARRCAVLFLQQELVSGWMRAQPRIAENYIRFLSGRIRFLNEKIAGFTGGPADGRLLRYLKEHRMEDGRVALPCSMRELAQSLNIGRSSLYRSLDALEACGVLRREGRRLILPDPPEAGQEF